MYDNVLNVTTYNDVSEQPVALFYTVKVGGSRFFQNACTYMHTARCHVSEHADSFHGVPICMTVCMCCYEYVL
jgi:hypothetical protein